MQNLSLYLLVCTVLGLSACGGGGGGDSASSSAASTAADAAAVSAAAASGTPTPAYVTGSEELAALNLLNAERSRCGFGQLAQQAQLDAAAKAHADYQIINNLLTHVEDRTAFPNGFSGVSALDRVIAKGYTGVGGVTDEIVGLFGTSVKTGAGASGIRGLLSAPYHLRGLVGPFRDIGISVRSNTDVGTSAPKVFLQIDAAYKSAVGPQSLAASDVNTYPCEGTTGVNRQLSNESPNPVPGRDLSVNPLGAVVYIGTREGNTLQISSASMLQVSTGSPVALRAPITAATDPYSPCSEGCFKSHQAYVAANAPLQANAAYQVMITGSNNGAAFSRVFTFTTGSGV